MAKKINKDTEFEEKLRSIKEEHEVNMILINAKMSEESRQADLFRARSFNVGTSFGGVTEITMRANSGHTYWAPLQPVEVVEIIQQLASNIGCHVALKPREDFASWRDWNVSEQEKISSNGWPPHVNDMTPYLGVGNGTPHLESAPGRVSQELSNKIGRPLSDSEPVQAYTEKVRSQENDETIMVSKKNINKRSSKRTTDTP